jgi:hypothetical protein
VAVVNEIRCGHCGAPINFTPGEIVATCKYCGFTSIIETGKPVNFEHSIIFNKYTSDQVENLVRNWMRSGFIKPGDLAKASKIVEKQLIYLPFWIIPATVISKYKGVFERLAPPMVKEAKIENNYNWIILARKAVKFPTREFDVPLAGKVPYDFRKIEDLAKILHSELTEVDAKKLATEQIISHQNFLAKQDVDKIIEMKNNFEFGEAVYLHAPIWFISYEYKKEKYNLILDGFSGTFIKSDIPPPKFSFF